MENDVKCKVIITQQHIDIPSEKKPDNETFCYLKKYSEDFKDMASRVSKTIIITDDILGELKALYFIKNQVTPSDDYQWEMTDKNTFVGKGKEAKLRVSNIWNTNESNRIHSSKGSQYKPDGKWFVGVYRVEEESYEILNDFR